MADKKISQLTGGGAAQATDEYVIARSGNNFKVTGANVAAAATSVGTLTSLTVSGNATFDTNTLFVDAANNRVGMGIASSLASVLHIKGPAGSNPATGGIVFQYSTNSNNYGAIGLDNASGSFAVLAGSGAELRFHTNSDLATSNLRWRMDTNGHFLANADNSFDIGASGANRPRSIYVGVSIFSPVVTATGASSGVFSASLLAVTSADNSVARLSMGRSAYYLANIAVGKDSVTADSTASYFAVETRNAAGTLAEQMRLNASGNLGLGVTPSAWTISGAKAIQVGPFASLTSNNSGGQFTDVGHNIFGAYSYLTTAAASFYRQGGGQHAWYSAPSGTAGNAITFTQAMTLDASGNLLLGRTSQVIGEKFSSTGYGLFGGATVQAIIGDAGTGQVSLGAYSNHAVELRTNNTNRWQISSAGHLLGFVDNTYDIGASGATRPRTIYVGTSVILADAGRVSCSDNFSLYDTTSSIDRFLFSTSNTYKTRTNGSHFFETNATTRFILKPGGQVRFVPLAAAPTANVEDGDVYYDSGTNKLRVRAGGAWTDLH
jgi:hypothetical protein